MSRRRQPSRGGHPPNPALPPPGTGQHVDVSMLGTLTSLIAGEGFDLLETLGIQLRTGPTVARPPR